MGTQDIARSMFDPRQHYTGKWTLQGRLITDFDENDREAILAEERRRAGLDIIGPYGSPDDGFRVDAPRAEDGFLEFDLRAGSLYLGGLRLELETPQTYRTQADGLQVEQLLANAANLAGRRDLVALEVFEAPVTAVEDGELLDPAVGVDTSARNRRFQRIRVLTGVSAQSCDQAWALLDAILAAAHAGALGADCRQHVDTRLSVSYAEAGIDDDLCEPPLAGGYLGAENQALRVQLVSAGTFTWGFDNGAPLYRVSLSADRQRVTLITPPRDLYSTPTVGQVIELLPWGAVLANGEKTAALSGHLTRIEAVDLADETAGGAITVTLADPVPVAGFDDWQQRPDAVQLSAGGIFYFMHLWNRGSDVTSPPAIPFVPGTPVTLGTTGIQITLTGADAAPEDHWIIAARPETPTQVFPWELERGAAPTGVHRYWAPLALIRWQADGTATVSDCRPPFRPLTARDGCCTYTVGDGRQSVGDFDDLNAALDRLGGGGGEICLLPGIHRADVALVGRSNVTISGCGGRSKLIPQTPRGGAVISLRDCAEIRLANFEIIAVDGTGVAAAQVDGLALEELKLLAGKVGLDVDDAQDVTIRRCTVRMLDKEGGDVGIYAQGERVLIEECDVQIVPGGAPPPFPDDGDEETPPVDPSDPCADPAEFYVNLLYLVFYVDLAWGLNTFFAVPKNPFQTLGGIQIGSGAAAVRVRQNTVVGGAGNGITLGSDIADVALDEFEPPLDPEEEAPQVRFTHEFDVVRGKVMLDNNTLGGVNLIFTGEKAGVFTFPVGPDGLFEGKLPPGEYTVVSADPQYAVTGVESLGDGDYFVFLRARQKPPREPEGGADLLAFIQAVAIEENRIANMGFSGIGAPRYTTADAAALREFGFARGGKASVKLLALAYAATGTITGFVVDLGIYRNTITRCLQNAPLSNPDRFTVERALGGISLALCDGVDIAENVIEDCGRSAEMPVCGVFISFAIDVTVRANRILNNGQDRRGEQLIADFVAGVGNLAGAPTAETAEVPTMKQIARADQYAKNQFTYNRFRAGQTVANAFDAAPAIDFARGPRAGILLPICLSTNVFAGGAAQKLTANLDRQGLTGAAEGRHAARIDGNYVVQPFGKSLFVGAAGTLSITDNQLISDRALPRELDALAGGLSGRLASRLILGPVDLFASNVMVVDICPGAYVIDALKLLLAELRGNDRAAAAELQPTPIPFGFPDGNVLFVGNQIKQGDAGARSTMTTIFTMDDVNFADNQLDVLNATDLLTTCVVFGVTARAANNRMKEPVLLTPDALRTGQRFSLMELGLLAGGMVNNQGHYCFKLFTGLGNGAALANIGLLAPLLKCGDDVLEQLPEGISKGLLLLLLLSARFAEALSKLGSD